MIDYGTGTILRECKRSTAVGGTVIIAHAGIYTSRRNIIRRAYVSTLIIVTRTRVVLMNKLRLLFFNVTTHINYLPFSNANTNARL